LKSSGRDPIKLQDPTRPVFKDREALDRRYIEMLRDIVDIECFMELEGARRWVPRDEQTYNQVKPSTIPTGPDGALKLQQSPSKANTKGKDKGKNPPAKPSRPSPSGLGNDGRGSGLTGGS
jgi:hypothetical protein